MSKYQALIDALAGVDGQLGQPSLHSGHVIYAETEEWCSVDINVKLSANKHISGPLARFIKEAANPSTIRALLADLERAEKALAAIAQQAQPAVSVVSDEQIDALAAGNNYPGTVPGYRRFARAILALRPAVEPMTDVWTMDDIEQACVMAEVSPAQFESIALWLETEGRGITAKAEDAHQPTKEAE